MDILWWYDMMDNRHSYTRIETCSCMLKPFALSARVRVRGRAYWRAYVLVDIVYSLTLFFRNFEKDGVIEEFLELSCDLFRFRRAPKVDVSL